MQAEINIKTLEVIAGSLPNRALSLVLEWANQYRQELLRNWERTQVPEQLKKIKPLK